MQPQMQAVAVLSKEQRIICQRTVGISAPCGGKGIVFQGAFLMQSILVGSKPEIGAALVVVCNKCGEDIEAPFKTAGEVKEA